MKKRTASIILVLLIFLACKKEVFDTVVVDNPATTQIADQEKTLYNLSKSDSGYTYYRNGDTLSGIAPSPHGEFKLRFNSIAKSVLDTNNELPVGGTFPENSMVIKEVYRSDELSLIITIQKQSNDPNAANGWLWVEFDTTGKVVHSITKKGKGCIGCHNTDANRDLLKTFDLH